MYDTLLYNLAMVCLDAAGKLPPAVERCNNALIMGVFSQEQVAFATSKFLLGV